MGLQDTAVVALTIKLFKKGRGTRETLFKLELQQFKSHNSKSTQWADQRPEESPTLAD